MMKVILCVLGLVFVFAQLSLAVPVSHDSPDGIAAVVSRIQVNDSSYFVEAVILGTDGMIYLLENGGRIVLYNLPYDLEISWPVEFSEIVDWTPLVVGVPGADDHFIHQGIVQTEGGAHWVQCVEVNGGWDIAGMPEVKLRWEKISLVAP